VARCGHQAVCHHVDNSDENNNNNNATCVCKEGYAGNPYERCFPVR
jgi:hypothetical protein